MAQSPTYLALPVNPSQLAEQSVANVLRFLRRRWIYIVAMTLVVGLLGSLIVLQATPLYTAVSSVAVDNQKGQVVNVQDVMSEVSPDDAVMATQAAIVRSPKLFGQLIDQMKLDQDPEFNPGAAPPLPFSIFNPTSWFPASPPAKSTPRQVAEKRAALISAVSKAFSIQPEDKSFIITISATSRDPMKATAMASALAELYIRDGIETKFDATRRASTYLQDRVQELRGEAVQSDRAAEAYRAQSGLTGATDTSTIDTQQLSEINSQLILARSERAAKEAQLNQIRALTANGDADIESSGLVLGSNLIMKLREQESEVMRNLAQLQATYGANHPRIINANAELRDLRSKIRDEIRKLAASTASDVAVARARENALAGSLGGLEGKVNHGGAAEVRLRDLQRESDASKGVYEVFLNRLKETQQNVDVQTADARIVAYAVIPLLPSSPKVGATIATSLVVGILLGTLLAVFLEKIDNTVRGSEMLERMGGGATLAHLPVVMGNFERPEEVVVERPQSMIAESLRTLRSGLALSDVDNPPKVIMVSSSVPAEGKTFVSVGLARVSAQSGDRTLLIDADMRHPRIHSALGIENGDGLIKVLSGECALANALQKDPLTNLDVLTAGRGVVNPPDLLRSENMHRLIVALRQSYDMIIFDTPPFVPMTDSQIIASMVDKMILVVRWGSTPVPVVENVIKQMRRVDAPLVGSVLSRVHFSQQAGYGYGDYGYHYSRYAAYYGTKE
jgi:succinoglycan biosynthesis transport protein ExoP